MAPLESQSDSTRILMPVFLIDRFSPGVEYHPLQVSHAPLHRISGDYVRIGLLRDYGFVSIPLFPYDPTSSTGLQKRDYTFP